MATEILGVTELTDSQAAKYATHNEALRQVEGRMVRVKSRTTTAQPGSPAAGDTYILPTGATGTDWAGDDGKIAHYYGGTWKFWTATEGARVWVNDEDQCVVYDGGAWVLDTRASMLTKSVAGGSNVTLTEPESSYPAIDCTGALTANIALIVTTTPKFFLIRNSTSGSYTLTVKTSAGTGVIVTQGARALLYCDGTNVVGVSGSVAFLDLTDTPASFSGQGGKSVRVNSGANALEFVAPVDAFVDLSDVPVSYSAQAGLYLRVNATEDGLEFASSGGGGGDVVGPASSTDEALTRFNGTSGTSVQNSTWTLSDAGAMNAADGVLQRPEIKDYAETRTTPSSSSGTLTLNLENGNVFEVTLTENVTTLTLSNPPASGKAGSLTLILKQDATGGRTFAWPAAVKSAGGTDPTISSAANAVDIYTLLTTDAGTTWYVFTGGKAFS